MTCRQIEFLLACLLATISVPSLGYGQEGEEPPSLLKGGFIQQLRALPEKSMEAFRSAERRESPIARHSKPQSGLRGTPERSPQGDNLPVQPSGRSTLRKSHESPWMERFSLGHRDDQAAPPRTAQLPAKAELRDRSTPSRLGTGVPIAGDDRPASMLEQRRLPEVLSAEQARQGLWLSDRSRSAQVSTPPRQREDSSGSSELVRNPAIYQGRQPSLESSPTRIASQIETAASETLTSDLLQQAPRVSRVPLPRPSTQESNATDVGTPSAQLPVPSNSDDAPTTEISIGETSSSGADDTPRSVPQRIRATAISSLPRMGATANASLRTVVEDAEAAAVSVPTQLLPRTQSELRTLTDQAQLPSTLPALPSLPGEGLEMVEPTSPSKSASADVPVVESFNSPTLELAAENLSQRSLSDAEEPAADQQLPAPSDPASLELEIPSRQPTAALSPQIVTTPTALPQLAAPSSKQPKTEPELTEVALRDQRLRMEAPRLEVLLNGPSDLPIGIPARYEVVVRNADSIELQGLILRLDIPVGVQVQSLQPTHGEFEVEKAADGLTMLTWGFERLGAGQTATAPMQLIASSSKNFAVAMEWTLMPIAGSSSIEVRAPRLELALEGPAEVNFGQPNVYRLHVRNPGNATASQVAVRLSAEPFGSSAAEIGQIAPGEEEVIDVELTFNERGAINITAEAQERTGLSSHTAIAVNVRQAIIESQILAAEVVYHGAPTECQVRLSNVGDADTNALRAVLQLPTGASLVSAPPGAQLNGSELSWPIDRLPAGSSEQFVVQLKLTNEGANHIDFVCRGDGNANTTAEATTYVESITDLKLFVNDPIAPAPINNEVVYELTLTNRGSKAATNVKVLAQFSEGIEPIRCEGQSARVVTGQAMFEPIAHLGAGQTVHLKVYAAAVVAGTHRFRVEVRSDDSAVRLVQEESTQYLQAISRMAAPAGAALLR